MTAATIKAHSEHDGAASDGGDVILYRMTREECRYVAQN